MRAATGELPDRGRRVVALDGLGGAELRARASAAPETSTATTRAPSAAPISTADSPTPPQPCTASQSSAPSRPCVTSARYAVANRHPSEAAVTRSRSSGSRTRLMSAACTATSSANEPGPVKPGWVWSGQTWLSPPRQYSQRPQPQTNGTVTRSPTDQRSTSGPTSATWPASSWPGTCGSGTGSWPAQACQSERHTPVAPTRTTTPSSGQTGSGQVRSTGSSPWLE